MNRVQICSSLNHLFALDIYFPVATERKLQATLGKLGTYQRYLLGKPIRQWHNKKRSPQRHLVFCNTRPDHYGYPVRLLPGKFLDPGTFRVHGRHRDGSIAHHSNLTSHPIFTGRIGRANVSPNIQTAVPNNCSHERECSSVSAPDVTTRGDGCSKFPGGRFVTFDGPEVGVSIVYASLVSVHVEARRSRN